MCWLPFFPLMFNVLLKSHTSVKPWAVQACHTATLKALAHRLAMRTKLAMPHNCGHTCVHDCWVEHSAQQTLARTTALDANRQTALEQGTTHSHWATSIVACHHLESERGTSHRSWSRLRFEQVLQNWLPGRNPCVGSFPIHRRHHHPQNGVLD